MKKGIVFILLFIAFSGSVYGPSKKREFCWQYDYCYEIVEVSKQFKVDPRLTLAIILHESGLDVGDYALRQKRFIRGNSGEYSIMQVMPANFRPREDKFDPYTNITAGLRYYKTCSRRSRNTAENISKYNRGCSSKRVNRRYVERVLENYRKLGGKL